MLPRVETTDPEENLVLVQIAVCFITFANTLQGLEHAILQTRARKLGQFRQ